MSAASATSWAPIAAPAGTPSERARVRCAVKGLGSNVQPPSSQRRVDGRGQLAQGRLAVAQAEPQRPRTAVTREHAGTTDRGIECMRGGACSADGIDRRRDPLVEGRTDEPKRQVKPIEPDPAHVPAATRHTGSADAIDEGRDGGIRVGRQGHRDEDATPRQVRPGPARATSGLGHAMVRPVSRSQASRSDPQDFLRSVVVAPADHLDGLVLERLVGLEEVLDLDQPVGTDLVETLDVLLVGVADGDAQDLEVEALLVAHLQAADGPRPDVAAGEGRLVDDQQRVGVIAVTRARALDEAVVEVVEDSAREDAVEPEDVRLLVVLVLVARPARDLDHDLDDLRERPRRLHPVSLVRAFAMWHRLALARANSGGANRYTAALR